VSRPDQVRPLRPAEGHSPSHLAPVPRLEGWFDEDNRQDVVNQMFDRGARHYDAVSQAMSFGTGKWYRRDALSRHGLLPEHRLLDVATGTGQVLQGALDLGLAPERVTGLDPSAGMLAENRRNRTAPPLVQGLGERLPFADGTFDFLTMGYALRHVPDLATTFAEYRRVLRPGGKVLLLEITKPGAGPGRWFTTFYMKRCVPLLTRLRTGSADASRLMRYYWDTIDACVRPESILAALEEAGFTACERVVKHPMLSEYAAQKPTP